MTRKMIKRENFSFDTLPVLRSTSSDLWYLIYNLVHMVFFRDFVIFDKFAVHFFGVRRYEVVKSAHHIWFFGNAKVWFLL